MADVDDGYEIEEYFAYKENIVAVVVAVDAFGDRIVALGKVGGLAVYKVGDSVVDAAADDGVAVVAGSCYCFWI